MRPARLVKGRREPASTSLRVRREAPAPQHEDAWATYVADDVRLRSDHVRELLREPSRWDAPCVEGAIPKVIVQFWHDSAALPADVLECLESWDRLAAHGFTRLLFDDGEATRFIDRNLGRRCAEAYDICYHPAMKCDYFRLCYLAKHGGFYVDADEFFTGSDCRSWFLDGKLKVQPLCFDRATRTMINPDIFVKSAKFSPDWTFYANNNPIIAPPGHPIIAFALERATRILLSRAEAQPEIQETTGPGNITASLVRHSILSGPAVGPRDFSFLLDWEAATTNRWSLSYRNDERNWRLWYMKYRR